MNAEYINVLNRGTILHGKTYRYEILDILGQGSFGIAYKARMFFLTQNESGDLVEQYSLVAVKEFFMKKFNGREGSSVTDGNSQGVFTHYKNEFEHEAANLRYMVHPHIVRVHELFYANDTVYYSMELLDKRSLDDLIKENGKLSLSDSLKFLQDIGSALSCMHDYKMLHLDLKPSNIMLNSEGEAVLIDFGLSKRYSHEGKAFSDSEIGKGTPGYAPFEQSKQTEKTDFAVTMDIYALGATFFKMLTGKRPPDAISIATNGFPAYILQDAGVDESIMPVIAKAMNPNKSKRFQAIDEFVNACLPEPDYEKANKLEKLAYNTTGKERIELLKAAYLADPTRLSVIKALDGHYIDGDIIEKDLSQSAEWCLKAAKLGDSEAQRDIADMYSCGDGVPQNDYLAVKWYREAAKNGNKYAPTCLARKYYDGKGVPQDYVEAYRWFSRSVEIQGKYATDSLYWLGYMHENGYGVDVDYIKAISFYKQVADSHEATTSKILDTIAMIPDCMFRLGYIYQHGLGIDKDFKIAQQYYLKASQYDHASALFNLGCMNSDGQGCEANPEKALNLWIEAANIPVYDDEHISSGGLSAIFNIGVSFEMGYGCNIDFDESLKWYNKALHYGHPKAESAIANLQTKMKKYQMKSSVFSWLKRIFLW